jgi:hypothetical protein
VSIVLQGVIRGKTIELETSPGIEDGRIVQVVLDVEQPAAHSGQSRGDETLTAAGMMADYTEDDDAVLAEIHRERKRT